MIKKYFTKEFLYCALSALLLILAFPKSDIWIFAWIGLVPLLFALDGQAPLKAFKISYVCGFFYFFGTLHWIMHVTAFGTTVLVLYLSLYFGLFGLCYSFFQKQDPIKKLFFLPSLWVGLEFIRAHLFTGFDWSSLGYSQYTNLPLIQIADITGLFGVSFLLVMANVFFKELITHKDKAKPLIVVTPVVFILVVGYGVYHLKRPSQSSPEISIGIVQGNIPQKAKWVESAWPDILQKYTGLTTELARHNPDLIIWPETSFPGYLFEDHDTFTQLRAFVNSLNVPLLFGAIAKDGEDYHNSSVLLSEEGRITQKYNKLHLVLFGEYIPLRSYFPFLSDIIPIADFTAGDTYTLFGFPLKGKKKGLYSFATLICFEDSVARLSREFADRGAQLLINITNDAWFHDSKAPFMHLQASVFRSVENRRSLVRVANTGISCFIDHKGRVEHYVQNQKDKKVFVTGYNIKNVQLNTQKSFYTKYGDIFTICCFGCILWGLLDSRLLHKGRGK